MYRAFVTCDDPKGVVDCGTVRKYKAGSLEKIQQNKTESRRMRKNCSSIDSSTSKVQKDKVVTTSNQKFPGPSMNQLFEVSGETRRLDQTNESWTEGNTYVWQSQGIAKNLLRGALDLQESLIKLGKLQESSQLMAQMKPNSAKGRNYEVGDNIHFNGIGHQNYAMGNQKERTSVDGSSRDSIEELKRAIRDGFARQRSLKNATLESTYNGRGKMDSASDLPSTSTSQSSVTHSSSVHSSNSSSLQKDAQKKEKGPSLIAKLMGLEDIPSKSLLHTPQKPLNFNRNSNQQRGSFDIELPKTKRSQPIIQKVDSDKNTLKEVLETLQFKGLLRSSSVEDFMSQRHQPNHVFSRQNVADEIMPIVLIKPVRVERVETNDARGSMNWEKKCLNEKLMPRKMDVKEEAFPETTKYKDEALSTRTVHHKIEAQNMPEWKEETKRLRPKVEAANRREVIMLPEEKKIIMDKKEDMMQTRFGKKERSNDLKNLSRTGMTGVTTKDKVVPKIKASGLPSPQIPSKKTTDKRVDKVQKVIAGNQMLVKKDVVKSCNMSRSQEQGKMASSMIKKSDDGLEDTKNRTSKQNIGMLKSISKDTSKKSCSSKDQQKKKTLANRPAAIKPKAQKLGSKDEGMRSSIMIFDDITKNSKSNEDYRREDLQSNNEHILPEMVTTVLDQPLREEKVDELKYHNKEVEDCRSHTWTSDTSCKTRIKIKALLLSTPSFLNQVEDIYHLNAGCENISTRSDMYVGDASDVTLYLDFAVEFIKHKSLPDSQTGHTLLPSSVGRSKMPISLDKMMDEICNGIKKLKSYSELLHADSLYAMLERDIKGNGSVSSIWHIGWRNSFSVEESEETLKDVENLIVSELIDELFP